ncbi:hypothetical protein V8F06_011994 [Rhypophila decipiens]
MATKDQLTRPILMRKRPRGYGRCDYERFDHIATSHVNAGRRKIGDVEVDCRFCFTKSRWGYLGSDYDSTRTPGGIIYLDLDFHQPSDCRLRAATVVVTLTDNEDESQRTGLYRWLRPVRFTSNYGPRRMCGAETQIQKRTVKQFTPHVEVMGQGAGGVGILSENFSNTSSRWKFSGHLGSTPGHNWDNKLKWVLEENRHEDQSMHSNMIHTAFAFEHNATQFFMTVEVRGKLVRTRDQLRSFKFKGQEKAVTIKFEWKNGYSCPTLLNDLAEDLHDMMEKKNASIIRAEIPDALPVDSVETTNPGLRPSTDQAGSLTPQATLEADSRHGIPTNTQMSIPGIMGPSQMVSAPSDDMMSLAAGLTLAPSLEPVELSSSRTEAVPESDQTAVNSTVSPRMRRARSRPYQPSLSTATTLVGEEEENKYTEEGVPWSIFFFVWLGQIISDFLDVLASFWGFSLKIELARKGGSARIKRMETGKDSPIEAGSLSGDETESSTLTSSPADEKGRIILDLKSEFAKTAGSFGTSTPMSIAGSEMSDRGIRDGKERRYE